MKDSNLVTILTSKPAKNGNHYHFTIPKKMIDAGVIDEDEFYELKIYHFDTGK